MPYALCPVVPHLSEKGYSEKFICPECGDHEHADLATAKTIRDRALELVRGDSVKSGVLQPLKAQKISQRLKLGW